jgi:hypothetical protein
LLLVGLPDKAVGEARERMRAAMAAMGLALPPRRVLINLAPADLLKEGSHFDLPIALAVLAAMDVLPREELFSYAALGELALDGTLNAVNGVLPAAIGASRHDLGLICPASQGGEAAWAGRIEVLAASDLLSLINHFRGTQVLTPPEPAGVADALRCPDLAEVKGMETAKRVVEIAAAGGPQPADGRSARLRQVDAGSAIARTAARPGTPRGARGQHDPQRRGSPGRRKAGDATAIPRAPPFGVTGRNDRRWPAGQAGRGQPGAPWRTVPGRAP